jgi:steroid delta-isomerase-like uncharacterized protein
LIIPLKFKKMNAHEIKDFIRNYIDEVWNKGRIYSIGKYFAPGYIHHDSSAPEVQTLEDYIHLTKMLRSVFSGYHIEIDDLVALPGKGVIRWTMAGVHTGEFMGIPATEKQVRVTGVTFYCIPGNRIEEGWYTVDMLGLLHQLGALQFQGEGIV